MRRSLATVLALVLLCSAPIASAAPVSKGAGVLMESQAVESLAWTATYRLASADRYSTASEIAEELFPDGADTVLVTTADAWADALCAAPLAVALGAPILLVPGEHSRAEGYEKWAVESAGRLRATRVIILGGTSAVTTKIETKFRNLSRVTTVERIAGADRYQTSRMIASRLKAETDSWSGLAFLSTGVNFPDALGASPVAGRLGAPIILNPPAALSATNRSLLASLDVSEVQLLGGTTALSDDVARQTRSVSTVGRVGRLAGSNRYATCLKVMDYALSTGDFHDLQLGLAAGTNFPDALAAGAALAPYGQLLVLLPPSRPVPHELADWLKERVDRTTSIVVFGGTSAVSDVMAMQVRDYLDSTFTAPGILGAVQLTLDTSSLAFKAKTTLRVRALDTQGRPLGGVAVETLEVIRNVVRDDTRLVRNVGDYTTDSGGSVGAHVGYVTNEITMPNGSTTTIGLPFEPRKGETVAVKVTATHDGITKVVYTSYSIR